MSGFGYAWPWRPRIVFGQDPPPAQPIPPLTYRRPAHMPRPSDLTDPDLSGNGNGNGMFSAALQPQPQTAAWSEDDTNVALYAAAAVGALLIAGYALTR